MKKYCIIGWFVNIACVVQGSRLAIGGAVVCFSAAVIITCIEYIELEEGQS